MTFIQLHRCVETPWNDPRSYRPDEIGAGPTDRPERTSTGEASAPNLSTDLRERLDGRPRRVTIHPAIPLSHVAVMLAVAAAIGFWLAVGKL